MNAVRQLAKLYPDLQRRGVEMVVIGAGKAHHARRQSERLDAPFVIVADPVRNTYEDAALQRKMLGTYQQSGILLIDRLGVVRYVRRATNPFQSFHLGELLELLDDLN